MDNFLVSPFTWFKRGNLPSRFFDIVAMTCMPRPIQSDRVAVWAPGFACMRAAHAVACSLRNGSAAKQSTECRRSVQHRLASGLQQQQCYLFIVASSLIQCGYRQWIAAQRQTPSPLLAARVHDGGHPCTTKEGKLIHGSIITTQPGRPQCGGL